MEHPPKQGLKRAPIEIGAPHRNVLMEHPPKQGLKRKKFFLIVLKIFLF